MYITTEPYFKDVYEEVSSLEEAKEVINLLISIIRKKKTEKVEVTITLENGPHTELVYYREDETLRQFKKRLLREVKKHL